MAYYYSAIYTLIKRRRIQQENSKIWIELEKLAVAWKVRWLNEQELQALERLREDAAKEMTRFQTIEDEVKNSGGVQRKY